MYRLINILIFIVLFVSCREKLFTSDVDCNECYTTESDSADLYIYFDGKYDTIPYILYRNEIGEENIDYIDTIFSHSFPDGVYPLYSKVNQKYTVKAEYSKGDTTIFAVDAGKIKSKRVSGECDEICWILEDGKLDIRLKFNP